VTQRAKIVLGTAGEAVREDGGHWQLDRCQLDQWQLDQCQLDHKACAAMVSAYGTAGKPGAAQGLLRETRGRQLVPGWR